MARLTLRVIDGADRGRIFDAMPTPVTIGREEGNTIQLNDERVSRYHVKIQEDHDKIVITDLESTTGTRVNGEDVQLRVLRFGDVIALGRSVLLFGNREQIANRLSQLRGADSGSLGTKVPSPSWVAQHGDASDFDFQWSQDSEWLSTLNTLEPPELPDRLAPGQAAQLSELLDYIHIRLRDVIDSVKEDPKADRVTLEALHWQELLDLQARVSEYLKQIGEP